MRKKGPREEAEAPFRKPQQTDQDGVEAERQAVRDKTSRLKALRLAKDAGEAKAEIEKKPAEPSKRNTKPQV